MINLIHGMMERDPRIKEIVTSISSNNKEIIRFNIRVEVEGLMVSIKLGTSKEFVKEAYSPITILLCDMNDAIVNLQIRVS